MQKMLCRVTLLLLFATATLSFSSKERLQTKWIKFKQQHKKTYTAKEEVERLLIFEQNLKTIEKHNELHAKQLVSYKMAVNQFADMTSEEFVKSNGYQYQPPTTGDAKYTKSLYEPPARIDWREEGAVSEVKNQGACGACWAFSTTGALEGQNYIKNQKLVSLSEQELVDCITERSVRGCYGGFTDQAYHYVMDNGLSSEEEYGYQDQENLCQRDSIPSSVNETGYVRIFGDEETLKNAVGTVGPIAVDVDSTKWQFYSEGIFYDETCNTDPNLLNHAVLAVGYDTEDGVDYWIIKNSYGPEWGEEGYIRMKRNVNNPCGIASTPSYPVL